MFISRWNNVRTMGENSLCSRIRARVRRYVIVFFLVSLQKYVIIDVGVDHENVKRIYHLPPDPALLNNDFIV